MEFNEFFTIEQQSFGAVDNGAKANNDPYLNLMAEVIKAALEKIKSKVKSIRCDGINFFHSDLFHTYCRTFGADHRIICQKLGVPEKPVEYKRLSDMTLQEQKIHRYKMDKKKSNN